MAFAAVVSVGWDDFVENSGDEGDSLSTSQAKKSIHHEIATELKSPICQSLKSPSFFRRHIGILTVSIFSA
jgi:hypothetical protein